ncbi:MAG: M1 family metallopeptidase [Chitinophagaceae bacterium]|nr:M1 family metallopeptidase [Chitinophagaceae bacterium]
MNRIIFVALLWGGASLAGFAQGNYWQQKVKYVMDVRMDVQTNRFSGKQKLEYWNNSPDTLYEVFYHLYWNAFQPNSMMDVRSRELGKIEFHTAGNQTVKDWDDRVRDRIEHLTPEEIGYQKVLSLKMNGVSQQYKVYETILEVRLSKPVLPKSKVVFEMDFEAQTPLQIRRSGRDNPNTGVRYSMSQWYPKMCEYDEEGWHPTPYIAREFYGVWGDYEVNITIDKHYILGATGYLQNPQEIGYGYEKRGTKPVRPTTDVLTWRFSAPNVHDFVWAADPQFKHLRRDIPGGPVIHVLYKYKPNDPANDNAWKEVADAAVTVLPFMEKHFGEYPYRQYSFIHGGDGGMEYPMATLISGPGLGTAFHEWLHSWYQMMLGTNESLYAWMDEGFVSFASGMVSTYYRQQKDNPTGTGELAPVEADDIAGNDLPLYHAGTYAGYFNLVQSGLEEPLTTHADHFNTNFAYVRAAYSKGAVFLAQLGYIISDSLRNKTLLEYYRQWRFKHPDANDFIRVAEKVSGLQLDWYKEYWINTTKTIDYGIDSLWEDNGKTKIRLRRIGQVPMPMDVLLQFKDGSKEMVYIPLLSMFGEKPQENDIPRTVRDVWKWTHPTYTIEVDRRLMDLRFIEIDPTRRMADVNRKNNKMELKW